MDTLYTFWDNITYYKTESVYFLGLMNSATKFTTECALSQIGQVKNASGDSCSNSSGPGLVFDTVL